MSKLANYRGCNPQQDALSPARFDTSAPTQNMTTQLAPLQYAPFTAFAAMLVRMRRR
ncbi:MAG: hypothetical protein PHU37_11310 [Methanoculleus chikugoensis]|nr:hypothetical protein [Methanoculleus chikugoensis]